MSSLKIKTDISVLLLHLAVAKAFWRSLILLKVSNIMPQAEVLVWFIHKKYLIHVYLSKTIEQTSGVCGIKSWTY